MKDRTYQQKLRHQLAAWQARIDQLKERMTRAGAETRRGFEHQLQDLQAKQRAARRKLDQFEHSGKSMRNSVRSGARVARDKVHRVVRRIASGFR